MNRRSFLSLFAALPVVGKYWKPAEKLPSAPPPEWLRHYPALIVAPNWRVGNDVLLRIQMSISTCRTYSNYAAGRLICEDGREWQLIVDGNRSRGYSREAHVYLVGDWRSTPNIERVLHRGFRFIEELKNYSVSFKVSREEIDFLNSIPLPKLVAKRWFTG